MHSKANIIKYGPAIAVVLLYITANMILTYRELYFLNFVPFAFALLLMAIVRLDLFYYLIVFFTPLSVQLIEFFRSSPVDFYIPTEPMLLLILILLALKFLYNERIDQRVMHHPVSYAVMFYIFWMFITTLTSSMPLVSFKYLLARIWFISTFYFLAIFIFRKTRNIETYIWCFASGMFIVIVYTILRHIQYGLNDRQAAHIVMSPFFRDHTSYGAVLAMLFFAYGGMVFKRGRHAASQLFYTGSLALISIALLLSYTRAAWISVFISFGVLALIYYKVRFRYILIAGVAASIILFQYRKVIIENMEDNRQASSVSISEHVRSISNITTDDSNMERINRWNSAIRMFREKPLFGWGPGTYMFRYAPFQLSSEMTAISTNFGNRGNAHSEYIGSLAESGIPGPISFIIIGITGLLTGFRVLVKTKKKRLRYIVMGLLLGLFTYFVHGLLNNFLDTDKISALFWGFLAVFVSMDVYYKDKNIAEVETL